MRSSIFGLWRLWVCLLAGLAVLPLAGVENARGADQDFLYLEMRRLLRDEPESPQNPSRSFAAGEYLFKLKHFSEAEKFFRVAERSAGPDALKVISKIYLSEIARLWKGEENPADLAELKETLTAKPFFSMFGKTKNRQWTSMLNNRYTLVEHVDRLEVRLNDAEFHTIRLP